MFKINLQFLKYLHNSTFLCHKPERIRQIKRLPIGLGVDSSNIVPQIPSIFLILCFTALFFASVLLNELRTFL